MANEMRVFAQTAQGKAVIEKQAKKTEMIIDPEASYQDHFVAVRPQCLVVKKYFIPSELPFDVPWDKIQSLTYMPQNQDNQENKVPGKGLDFEERWWAQDVLRPHERELHLYNVRIDVADMKPEKSGFTVIYIDQFLKACRHLLPYSCKLSGCMWSEKPDTSLL